MKRNGFRGVALVASAALLVLMFGIALRSQNVKREADYSIMFDDQSGKGVSHVAPRQSPAFVLEYETLGNRRTDRFHTSESDPPSRAWDIDAPVGVKVKIERATNLAVTKTDGTFDADAAHIVNGMATLAKEGDYEVSMKDERGESRSKVIHVRKKVYSCHPEPHVGASQNMFQPGANSRRAG